MYIYIYIYIRYSEVTINYLKYFGMLPSSVNLFLFSNIYIYVINIKQMSYEKP